MIICCYEFDFFSNQLKNSINGFQKIMILIMRNKKMFFWIEMKKSIYGKIILKLN